MLEKFLKQTKFTSYEDFVKNFEIITPKDFNFAYDVVDEWASIAPDKKALCWVNDKNEQINFTFGDIKKYSDMTASFFQSLGISKGDRVMLMLKRHYEFWFCIIALHKLGAITIPATHLLTDKDIIYRNNAADVKMIVADADPNIIHHVDGAIPFSPTLHTRVCVKCEKETPHGWINFHEGIESAKPFKRPKHVNKNEDISLIYFTSGTTASPKMAAHDFLYPLGHIATGSYWHNLNEESLHLTVSDTGWGKAVWGKLYGQWIAGANVFVYDHEKFTPAHILEAIEKFRITSFCAPPTIFRFMIKEDLTKYDLSSLKYCTIAGEALNPSVFDTFNNITGIKMMEGFGQTETTLTIATFPWITPKPGSMGRPNPQYDVDLLTKEGTWAKPHEHGEIVIKTGKTKPIGLFREYFRAPELTKEVWHDNIYHTGDVAYRDEEGYFWFVGRADDIIKSSGYRISPFEVESVLMTHPAVVECAVTGYPDEVRGQAVKATIILSKESKDKDKDVLIKDIQTYVKNTTAPYKYPRIIEFVTELPKTISGKIRRFVLRQNDKND